ncbi:MAG: DciA family protein [Pseudomonadota bacterium]
MTKPGHTPRAHAALRRRGAQPLGGFVPSLTRAAFERHGFATAAIATDWAHIVGPAFAAKCLPERLVWPHQRICDTSDGAQSQRTASRTRTARSRGREDTRPTAATLHLAVEPAFALDIQYASAQLQDRINAYFGYRAIGTIRLRQVPLATAGRALAKAPANADARSGPSSRPLSPTTNASPDPQSADACTTAKLNAALQRLGSAIAEKHANKARRA